MKWFFFSFFQKTVNETFIWYDIQSEDFER